MQRYKCTECGQQFQSERRKREDPIPLWKAYTEEKRTLEQLAEDTGHSHVWVRDRLDRIDLPEPDLTPVPTVAIADTTFWGRTYGVCVFRAWPLGRNIWWNEVRSELMAHYRFGRAILEEKGWTLLAVVVDGKRGFLKVFEGIPVQICQFHQMKQITKYLTRRPKTEAGRELRALALTLTKTDETTFSSALTAWHERWGDFIEQKTEASFSSGRRKWYYTHKNLRSAYRSLKTNLPYLFTYQKYPELDIPNTTNSLDGSFSALKKKLAVHHGLRRDRRYKVISKLLRDGA